jgi:hypothetical protein
MVTDSQAPVPAVNPLPDVTGECSASVTAPTATDNCAGNITATTTNPTTYTIPGTYTVTWTYNDGYNTITQTQKVIVTDSQAPVPAVNPLPDATGECSVTLTAPTATDNCAGAITATTADPLTYTAQGTRTVTWTYDDGHGNITTQTQTVIVADTQAPAPDVNPLPDVTGECSVTLTPPTATDHCAGAITATTADPVTYTTQGTYTVTWTYDDGQGNITPQTQNVVVDDTTLPVADAGANQKVKEGQSVTLQATATDNCDTSLEFTWSEGGSTLSNSTSFTHTFALGTHTVSLEAQDDAGNVGTDSVIVEVKKKSGDTSYPYYLQYTFYQPWTFSQSLWSYPTFNLIQQPLPFTIYQMPVWNYLQSFQQSLWSYPSWNFYQQPWIFTPYLSMLGR